MSTATLDPRMREVLRAPRGRRFSPGAAARGRAVSPTSDPWFTPRGQAMLARMRGNPRVEYRLQHGPLPTWMRVEEERRARPIRGSAEREPRQPSRPERGRHRRRDRLGWWVAATCCGAFLAGAIAGQVSVALL
ncbi:hypothetical protein [Nocardiopsis synnemataformans]|uniref:hypothetical protein n=1 Tax=Nocardiopsis synnemataformans TaxID=61305 RepID=UPI003EBA3238